MSQAATNTYVASPSLGDSLTRRALKLAAPYISGRMHITFPNGQSEVLSNGRPGPVSDIRLHTNKVLRRLMSEGSLGFAESYLEGEWDSSDLQGFLDHVHEIDPAMYDQFSSGLLPRVIERLRFWLKRNHKAQARKNISYHYDLGNDFYALWLDETMTYSSALFETGGESLETAQTAKYAALVDALGVQPGDHVLEIGCGWGGFAEYAAKERGLKVTGLTLSAEQLAYAEARIAKAGLRDKVDFKLQDYRDETGQYDGIASIEMFEAVGEQYWPVYFQTLQDRLKPGCLANLQIITVPDHRFETYRSEVDFIQKYIFPGGMLPSPSILRDQAGQAGLDVQGSIEFGKSYSQTLRRWHEMFNAEWERISAMGFDDRFRRMWNFYLTSCASTFETGYCDVTQITLRKPL